MIRSGNYRWWVIASLLATITAINYIDRQTLAVVVSEVKKDIVISEAEYGRMTSMFLVGYAIMYVGGGWLVDRVGTRWGYVLIAGGWSIACAAHSLVATASGLIVARFALGFAEGGGFPASAKAVSEWFTPQERSIAIGIFNTGSAVGATIAPPLIAALTISFGWRGAFISAAMLGLVWAIFWGWLYRPMRSCTHIGESERAMLVSAGVGGTTTVSRERWLDLLKIREVWILMIARFLTGGPWFFMIFWFPKYLGDQWQFDTKQVGWFGWLPYAFAGIGSLFGGWFSAWLIKRGFAINVSRKLSLAISASLLPAAILIAFSPRLTTSPALAITCGCIAFLGHQFWSVIMHTLTPDLFPSRIVGSAAGLIGMSEAAGSALFAELVGRILEATSRDYTIPFILTGLLHPVALLLIYAAIPRIARLKCFQELEPIT
jgi:MFS transporter, ACS family, hexuronate transporter